MFFSLSHDPRSMPLIVRFAGVLQVAPTQSTHAQIGKLARPQQTTSYNVGIDRMPAWMASRQGAGPSSRNGFVENHDFGKEECRASHKFETTL
jgi:hypothetical protein